MRTPLHSRVRAGLFALAVALAVAGCGQRTTKAPETDAHATAARAQAMIEAGNQAFEAGEYSLAAKRYAAAAVSRPDDPAAFFGLGMALAKLGRDEEARAAYARARELTRARQP